MHRKGIKAWFSDGKEERETILKAGEPWKDKTVLEIGCGEGDLLPLMQDRDAKRVWGVDYSEEAYMKALNKYLNLCDIEGEKFNIICNDYHNLRIDKHSRLVMQGVLEHLDDPFKELKWMIDNLLEKGGDVITSSPCFLNTRGIVWMTLNMLGAVMSKTDLHYLNPWEFEDFCDRYGYGLSMTPCDWSWGNDGEMTRDLAQRIPLALKDGNLPCDQKKIDGFLDWLFTAGLHSETGATMIYKISTKG